MSKKKKAIKEVLITDMDGFNVHNPAQSSQFVEFSTLDQAVRYAGYVKKFGWDGAKEMLADFQKMIAPAGARETS